jgi:hypothetical protein
LNWARIYTPNPIGTPSRMTRRTIVGFGFSVDER